MIRAGACLMPLTLETAYEVIEKLAEDRYLGGLPMPDEVHVSPEAFRELVAAMCKVHREPTNPRVYEGLRRVEVAGMPFVKQEAVRDGHLIKVWRD